MFSVLILVGTAALVSVSKAGYTYCYNATQCENETISSSYAACYGYEACKEATIDSTYTLAYGALGCYVADIDSEYGYAYGHHGIYGANMEVYELYAYGYQGARIANIEPYSDELIIYFYGYYAGYAADISCYDGDTCYIYCGGSYGCKGVDYYCYSGATCYYDCSSDDVCPTVYSGVESDLTYVTSVGTGTYSTGTMKFDEHYKNKDNININDDIRRGNDVSDIVTIVAGLDDDEISSYRRKNRLNKDTSEKKLIQDIKDDTHLQMQMTLEQNYWEDGSYDVNEDKTKKENRYNNDDDNNNINRNNNDFTTIHKTNTKGSTSIQNGIMNNGFLFGISLSEYAMAFIIDVALIAIAIKTYRYCMKEKGYQPIQG